MFKQIPGSEDWHCIKQVEKGWSSDTKYYIEHNDGRKLLLRVADISHYQGKEAEYERMKKLVSLGFLMSRPVDFGICEEGKEVYSLLTWIEGTDLETILPSLSQEEQYHLGCEAGKILKKIHSLPVPPEEIPAQTRVPKKLWQMQSYVESEHRINGDEEVLDYFYQNAEKMWSVPPVFQHGDYHPGNLILTPEHKIGVIDFNRSKVGDPFEEFYKLESFGTEVSVPYCIGEIDAYFDGDVPDFFWEILAVYVAHSSLYSIKWAEPYGKQDVEKMIRICRKSMEHYDNFKRTIPKWYKKEWRNDRNV